VVTKDNLVKREVKLSCNLCTLCGVFEKSVQRLLQIYFMLYIDY